MAKVNFSFVKLGIFVLTGSMLLLVAAYLIGNEQKLFSRTFELTTVFNNVGGLQIGNNVRYSGINAGTVREITMETDSTIRVYMRIDEDLRSHIKKDALAMLGSDGLVGSMLINIVPGSGNPIPVASGDEIQSFSRISTQDMLNTLNVTNENAALLTADLLSITQSIRKGEGIFARLLTDSLLSKNVQETLQNLNSTTQKSDQALTQINSIISDLNYRESALSVLLDDPKVAAQLRSTVAGLDSSVKDIRRISTTLMNLAGTVQEGKGPVGMALKDSMAADDIRQSLKYLESGLQKFDQNMEALKHNVLTRGYFRKQEREAKKEQQ